ncbi:MAG TPA: HAD family phosphatase [Saprospiraceae bacterium]|nr:HAD family phosphatase [Saprospiraceae bacterium]
MQIPKIEAIIFDMDGTLVNTEPLHCKAWLNVLGKRGFHYDDEWFSQWIGKADRFLAQGVVEEHGLKLSAQVLQKEKENLFHALAEKETQTFPGLTELLSLLKGKLPMAIATNSSRKDAEKVFIPTQLDQWMDAVVTSDDVEQLKPAPDMYLLAAKKLGVQPEYCLVIEDSAAGARGAVAAGMYVLGVTSSIPADRMQMCAELFPHPTEAYKKVRAIVGA